MPAAIRTKCALASCPALASYRGRCPAHALATEQRVEPRGRVSCMLPTKGNTTVKLAPELHAQIEQHLREADKHIAQALTIMDPIEVLYPSLVIDELKQIRQDLGADPNTHSNTGSVLDRCKAVLEGESVSPEDLEPEERD
jgi:hypothetical protein